MRAGPQLALAITSSIFGRAMTATELAAILCVSRIIIHKLAKKNHIPSLGLGCGRFDPKAIAAWLRAQ